MSHTFLHYGTGNLQNIDAVVDEDDEFEVYIHDTEAGKLSLMFDDIDAAAHFVNRLAEALTVYRARLLAADAE